MIRRVLFSILAGGLMCGGAAAADLPDVYVGPVMETPAPTYDFYVALKIGGGPLVPDTDYTAPATTFRPTALLGDISYDQGWFGAIEAGYFFTPNIRAGVEFAYGSLEPESMTGRAANNAFPPFTVAITQGDIDTMSAVAELAYEFDAFGAVRPYVKAGAGVAHISLDNVTPDPNNFIGFSDDSDTVFVGRVGAGVAIAVAERVDLIGEYDFTFGQDADFDYTLPGLTAPFSVEVKAHRVAAGLRFRF